VGPPYFGPFGVWHKVWKPSFLHNSAPYGPKKLIPLFIGIPGISQGSPLVLQGSPLVQVWPGLPPHFFLGTLFLPPEEGRFLEGFSPGLEPFFYGPLHFFWGFTPLWVLDFFGGTDGGVLTLPFLRVWRGFFF